MTSGFGWDPNTTATTAILWEDLAALMTKTKAELSAEGTSGFAPSIEGAASRFLTAWSGFAGESSAIADGFCDALHQSSQIYGQSDQSSSDQMQAVDGRLGPAL